MLFKNIKAKKTINDILNSTDPHLILKDTLEKNPKLSLKVINDLKDIDHNIDPEIILRYEFLSLFRLKKYKDAIFLLSGNREVLNNNYDILIEIYNNLDIIKDLDSNNSQFQVFSDFLIDNLKNSKSIRKEDIIFRTLSFFLRYDSPKDYEKVKDIAYEYSLIGEDNAYRIKFLDAGIYLKKNENIKAVKVLSMLSRNLDESDHIIEVHEMLKALRTRLEKKYKKNNISPDDILAYSLIFIEQKDFNRASKILKESLEKIEKEKVNSFLYEIAMIYKEKGDWKQCLEYLIQILDHDKFDISAINAFEQIIGHLAKESEVLEIEDPALKKIERKLKEKLKEKIDISLLNLSKLALGKLYYYQNRKNQSHKLLEEIITKDINLSSPEHLYIFSRMLMDNNKITDAVNILKYIEAEYPDSRYHTEAINLMKGLSKDFAKKEKKDELSPQEQKVKNILEDTLSKKKLINRLKEGLSKTHNQFIDKLDNFIKKSKGLMEDDIIEELEELLILSDIGMNVTSEIISSLENKLSKEDKKNPQILLKHIKDHLINTLSLPETGAINVNSDKPYTIMVVGVNGVGKTTTIAKLAHQNKNEGKSVMLAACDTFRAAAIEQLEVWADRIKVPMIKHKEGSDPSAVAYDAINSAKAKGSDILIIDTAGRLHTKANLMQELEKIKRTISRQYPGSPHSTILVLDATNGQNAIIQAKQFKEIVDINGIILTKLDGTAKGGIIAAIAQELQLPIKYIGVGEKAYDLMPFEPASFIETLFQDIK